MLTLKILATLLHYPEPMLQEYSDELIVALDQDNLLRCEEQHAITRFIKQLAASDLLDAQATYVETFDRGRSRSLYLFEHVHGESRDRGEAMVELLQAYREAGYDIAVRELPDYVPLFLEFLSMLPAEQALVWLEQTGHLLQMLHARLTAHDSCYAILLEPLVRLAGMDPHDTGLHEQVAAEKPDDTPQALDQVWMEAPVTFGPEDGGCCETGSRRQMVVKPLQQFDTRSR